eukprot:8494671-Pyramimonas_sp.AAC.1
MRLQSAWKFAEGTNDEANESTRLRSSSQWFMDTEAFDVVTFSGTARRSSQRLLAIESACRPSW